MATVLFFIGLVLAVIIPIISLVKAGEDKRALVASPFMFLIASAVARYLGM